ncbi:MAG TPA: stage II sporulation protein M [Solirubrobacterales bacterium]
MAADDYVLVQGIRATRGTLERWQERPWPILRGWFALSLAIAGALLAAVWLVAQVATPDPTSLFIPGIDGPPDAGDAARILGSNALVLALHAMACVAGFIAGSSMRLEAERRTGLGRAIHVKAGAIAIAWVGLVTAFSLVTQAYALGSIGADLAGNLAISPTALALTVLPHALLELVALFLPLAAWLLASRRGAWDQLMAATFVTVAIAIPMLVASAIIELTLWPLLLEAVSPIA